MQHGLAAPHKLAVDGLHIDHEAFVDVTEPDHHHARENGKRDALDVPAFMRVEPAIGSGPVSRKIG